MNVTAAIVTAARAINTVAHRIVEPTHELPEDSAFRALVAIDREDSRDERTPAPFETGGRFSVKQYAAYRSNVQAAMNAHHSVPVRDYDAESIAYASLYN